MACCRGKEKEAAVFDLVKKEDVEDQMRFFYEALTPFTFMMFRVNMVVNRVLQEPVEALKGLEDRELVKYLNLVVQFARKSVGMEESENMMELEALEAKEALLKAQVEELNEMKKKVKKGEAVRVLSKKEKKLMKPKPVDRKKEEKRMKKEYKEMLKKVEEEEKSGIPVGQRVYVRKTKEEWEREWKGMLAARVRAEDEEREKIRHLFEKQPTLSEVKDRIRGFESKLEGVQAKIEAAKTKSVESMKFIVKRNIDPRITIAWCKRV